MKMESVKNFHLQMHDHTKSFLYAERISGFPPGKLSVEVVSAAPLYNALSSTV